MAFNHTNTANKTAFSIELKSRKTGALVGWVNLPDSFVTGVFQGKRSVKELTVAEVAEKLKGYYDNDRITAVFTDTTAEKPVVALEDF